MSRDYKVFLQDILDAIKKIEKYTKGVSLIQLKKKDLVVDGVARNLEIIGEAAKNLSQDLKDKVDLPWKDIMGMRDIAIHEYFEVDLQTVWDTATQDVPVVREKLLPYKPREPHE